MWHAAGGNALTLLIFNGKRWDGRGGRGKGDRERERERKEGREIRVFLRGEGREVRVFLRRAESYVCF